MASYLISLTSIEMMFMSAEIDRVSSKKSPQFMPRTMVYHKTALFKPNSIFFFLTYEGDTFAFLIMVTKVTSVLALVIHGWCEQRDEGLYDACHYCQYLLIKKQTAAGGMLAQFLILQISHYTYPDHIS